MEVLRPWQLIRAHGRQVRWCCSITIGVMSTLVLLPWLPELILTGLQLFVLMQWRLLRWSLRSSRLTVLSLGGELSFVPAGAPTGKLLARLSSGHMELTLERRTSSRTPGQSWDGARAPE